MGKRGPAPSYKPDYCPIAYKFCLLGATNEDLADVFKVSRNTIGNWLARYPEFSKAVQGARDVPTSMSPMRCCRRPRASPTPT